ncbi:MAG: sigma-54 dependent transcriptional regulator [Thermoguttaceae bacterium]|nr:sigma-54 dependent transcriptional regulator [Thermoguttaceae bacterium]MDW8039325.1 sigma-54 dependent transcriptional regulator [Thermoguttaceae bacterium]
MAHLLIVDDEPSICWGLQRLAEQMGHTASVAASAEQAMILARQNRPDVIIMDVRLPGMDGLEALKKIHADFGPLPVIIITAFGDLPTAVEAIRTGAFEYLTKPFELRAAERAIQRAIESIQPPLELRSPGPAALLLEDHIVGRSPLMQELFKRIALVAPTEACVHLRGESGTGKELVARALHRYSRRHAGPFVAVNLAALSPSLIESELFGHTEGAFTGAERARKGLLEAAHGGTLFLDEVADIPPAVQIKLLRALEYGEVLPVGADRPIRVDFRLITATNRDLRRRVAEGKFRHDLYYRICTFEIELPTLAQRPEDIPELAEHFLTLLSAKHGLNRPRLAPETLVELQKRPWYGNVRELRNALEHALVLVRGNIILPEHLPPPASQPPRETSPADSIRELLRDWAETELRQNPEIENLYEKFLQLVEPPVLEAALNQTQGQYAAAARRLGLHRITLRKKLQQYGISKSPPSSEKLPDS